MTTTHYCCCGRSQQQRGLWAVGWLKRVGITRSPFIGWEQQKARGWSVVYIRYSGLLHTISLFLVYNTLLYIRSMCVIRALTPFLMLTLVTSGEKGTSLSLSLSSSPCLSRCCCVRSGRAKLERMRWSERVRGEGFGVAGSIRWLGASGQIMAPWATSFDFTLMPRGFN